MINLNAPSYTAWLSMTDEQRAPWAAYFAAVNDTPALAKSDLRRQAQKEAQARLEARWQLERFPQCQECHGEGVIHIEPDMSSTYRNYDMECLDCDGKGYTELPYADWLDTVSEDDPDFIAYTENY